jgi:type III secretion protein V
MIQKLLLQFRGIQQEIAAGNLTGVLTRFSDLLLVTCVALMVGMMIVPLPTFLLDIFLTVNITVAVIILMVSIYISTGTQIASYPTLLLITTLYRLSLDISATRLILLRANAGEVIHAFGMFVVSGNFVVGAVIFLIITLVQFTVITKGAERVAEVSARFTLDAMPGKQMSIDADMRAGIIDFEEARRRREALARESQFYGAMDGAMKFVKGDAIAGIVISLINIIGGLIIGVAMRGLSVSQAVQTYSVLTIGNGLVTQIPALLISISAGMVVTRVTSESRDSNLGKDVAAQILAQPKAIAVAAGILFVMALIPGLPKIPFFILALATGSLAYGLFRAVSIKEVAAAGPGRKPPGAAPEDVEVTVTVPLVLEVGKGLAPYVDVTTAAGKRFYEMLVELRNSLYHELGVIFPSIQIIGNSAHEGGAYKIWMNEVPAVTGQLRLDAVLVNDSAGKIQLFGLHGENAANPATGKPAAWISRDQQERAVAAGLQVWDTHEILVLHLAHFLKRQAREFLGLQEVQWMVDTVKQYYPTLVEELLPKPVGLQQLTEILRRLVEEEVSIRDLKTIFQALSEWARVESDAAALTEHVRTALKRNICYQLSEGRPTLFVYQLDHEIEELFREAIRQTAAGPALSMDPETMQQIMSAAQKQIGSLPPSAQRPVVLTDRDLRRFVRRVLTFHFPDVAVLSYDQFTREITLQPLGVIALDPEHAQEHALEGARKEQSLTQPSDN